MGCGCKKKKPTDETQQGTQTQGTNQTNGK